MARNIAPATVFDADASNARTIPFLRIFEDTDGFLAVTDGAGGAALFIDTDNFAAPSLSTGADKFFPTLLGNFIQILEP